MLRYCELPGQYQQIKASEPDNEVDQPLCVSTAEARIASMSKQLFPVL
jgi:hypothetical protein